MLSRRGFNLDSTDGLQWHALLSELINGAIQWNFDGKNICPDEPVKLPKDVSLRITVETVKDNGESSAGSPADFFNQLEDEVGLIDGPTDWAVHHDSTSH